MLRSVDGGSNISLSLILSVGALQANSGTCPPRYRVSLECIQTIPSKSMDCYRIWMVSIWLWACRPRRQTTITTITIITIWPACSICRTCSTTRPSTATRHRLASPTYWARSRSTASWNWLRIHPHRIGKHILPDRWGFFPPSSKTYYTFAYTTIWNDWDSLIYTAGTI